MVTLSEEMYSVLQDMTRSAFGVLICGGSPPHPVEMGRSLTGLTLVHTPEDYRIFIGGLPEEQLYDLGLSRAAQIALFQSLEEKAKGLSQRFGCPIELFMDLTDRRFIFLVSTGALQDAQPLLRALHAAVQETYRSFPAQALQGLELVSAVTPPLRGFGMHIRAAFCDALYCLDQCRFFLKGVGIARWEEVERTRRSVEDLQLIALAADLTALVEQREGARAESLLRQLFFTLLKPSFSLHSVRCALARLSPLTDGADPQALLERYPFLEDLFDFLLARVRLLAGDERRPLSPGIDAACAYIAQHFASPLTLEELAGQVGFSRTYLCSKFKAETGVSVHQMLLSRRLEAAKQLLRESDAPVGAVAADVGFDDVNYFRTCFRRAIGLTPSQYRSLQGPRL